MSLRINHNVLSTRTYGTLSQTSSRLEKSIQKLSSGLRINSAADDAAGLAISEKMRRQIRGLSRATLNAQDGISMLQTAEGAMNESHSILQRMRELAVQSSNDTLTGNDRLEIQKEVNQLKDDINRISTSTEFNTKKLLDGSQTALISSSSNAVKGLVTGAIQGGSTDYDVSIGLLKGGVAQMQRSQIMTLNDGSGTLANGGTQLQSIAQFYDSNGVFVLDTPQVLTINGDGKSTNVNLDGQMTLDNLAASIQNAIVSKSGLDIDNSRVATINTVQTQVAGMGGYLQVTSGSIGDSGRISFSSDQKVIDSLGLSVNREAINNRVQLTTRDNYGNVRQISTENDKASGLLNGLDIQFSSQAAQIAGTQGLQQGLIVSSAAAAHIQLSAGETTLNVTVAQGYWTMEGLARTLNAQISAASIAGFSAHVVEGNLRLSYDKPASVSATVANTINVVSQTTGAQSLGFTNGVYSGFVDATKNKDAARWGFSTYDNATAGGHLVISTGDGINAFSSAVTIVTSSNVADMTLFTTFQAQFNSEAQAKSVAVRVDQAGSAMVFTSTRVGTENVNNTAAKTSMVSINFAITAGGNSNIISDMAQELGITEGTAKGSGDQNFKLHVVDNSPQFQIGADQGQTMSISIGNMSAEALGIDKIDLTTSKGASEAIGKLDKAIDRVSSERSKIGAYQNRLEHTINNLRNAHSNLSASESRIRDTDIAQEMIEFTRDQIVSQSGTAMLAQANMVPQGVLQLLK